MYSPKLANALAAVITAHDGLDVAMRLLSQADVTKIMNDSGYTDRYTTTQFLEKNEDTNTYIYGIAFPNADEPGKMDYGRVYIGALVTFDEDFQVQIELKGDY
jgi:hypothetical protein